MNIFEFDRSAPLIELRGVHKKYQMGEESIHALKGIDIRIQSGEFVAVWGPSGSGKSTLCNLIGLLDTPSAGAVHLNGQDVTKLRDDRRSEVRNKAMGFIFQSFNLIPVLSALENVMLPLQIAGVSAKVARQQALERLAEMGLERHKTHRPAKLSGGQQQRVAIARALVSAPVLVIADEPTANLDSENAVKIIDLMRDINSKKGTTFIFSTHDQRLLERVGRQVLMHDGEIAEDKLPEKPEAFRVAGVSR
ncbi:MAG: ABC transporter ATP-binding protein [Methylococcales bacterium]|nr:ABC transporter ATP-binding protein [Methylococcales bacterium]